MVEHRELTGSEKRRIRQLVTSRCANYDKEYGCLPLDSDCYMFGIAFMDSPMCRYFRKAVLPGSPELEAALSCVPTAVCKQCGRRFPKDGKRQTCSEHCAEEARRHRKAENMRRYRARKSATAAE